MTGEDRLRQLLRDPGWSLPPRPDAILRIRRAARRQRLIATSVCASVVVAIATAAVVPAVILGAASEPATAGHNTRPAVVHPNTSSAPAIPPVGGPNPPATSAIPPVGSAGFPAQIYPAATTPRTVGRKLALCPASVGLQTPGPATPAAAELVLRKLGRGFTSDLQLSDRAAWPLLTASLAPRNIRHITKVARSSIRYSGPLQPGMLANLYHSIVTACGKRVAAATWVIAYGSQTKLSLDAHILFLTRRGHMLFYSTV